MPESKRTDLARIAHDRGIRGAIFGVGRIQRT